MIYPKVLKSGYINVFNYKSAQHLADHLKYLDSNRTAYNEYFKWKKYVKFDLVLNSLCELCIQSADLTIPV